MDDFKIRGLLALLILFVISCSNELDNYDLIEDVVVVEQGYKITNLDDSLKTERIITTENEFLKEWNTLFPDLVKDLPEIKFSERDIMLIVTEVYSSGGIEVGNFQMLHNDQEILIEYSLVPTGSGCTLLTVMSQPFLIMSVPALVKNFPDVHQYDINFNKVDYNYECN